MSDNQPQQPALPANPAGDRWGDPITPERAATLKALADQQRAWADGSDHQGRESYFKGVPLTGADVFWLAAYALAGPEGDMAAAQERLRTARDRGVHVIFDLSALHLEGADLREAHLDRVGLSAAHLERADLTQAHLEGAYLWGAHLERADLRWVHLEGADLREAHLEGADLGQAHLERADLREAHLEGADLGQAHLEGAVLYGAHLERADLYGAHLERAGLSAAHLERANLRGASFDAETDLRHVMLAKARTPLDRILRRNSSAALVDIRWHGVGAVDLTAINWGDVVRLGDERLYEDAEDFGDRLTIWINLYDHEDVVRAYRQLAAQLRVQGLSEVADRFTYRAQVRQRGVLLRRFRLPQYLGSWLLALLAGYGYRPSRTILLYVLLIAGFAATYFAYGTGCHIGAPADIVAILTSGQQCIAQPLTWNEAFVVSLTAFHGRGFFVGTFKPSDPQAAVAAAEAVVGLLLEVSFIATFTQRLFGSK